MGTINFLSKEQADKLSALGFKYQTSVIDGKTVYKFLNTPELESYLNSNFSNQEYFVLPYMNF